MILDLSDELRDDLTALAGELHRFVVVDALPARATGGDVFALLGACSQLRGALAAARERLELLADPA